MDRSLISVAPIETPHRDGRPGRDTRRRGVAEVLVLGADDRRDHLAEPGAAIATDARDRRVAALYPRAADEAHARQPERQRGFGADRRRRDDGNPQRLHLPQARRADLERVGAEGNSIQTPTCTIRIPPPSRTK